MSGSWMIYGAYGYTGELMAREAKARGMSPILTGRDEQKLRPLAESLGLEYQAFDLESEAALAERLADIDLVLHCAGPFRHTARPMIHACLESHTHYLDITGEIEVFALAHGLDEQARHQDVVLLPGVGFDVVPTDCLAARLAERLPAATHLTLAFRADSGPSPGTARTVVEGLAEGGYVRRGGELVRVPLAAEVRDIPFASGEARAVTIPWGDVYTGFVSTGIPDIKVFMAMPPAAIQRLRGMRRWQWAMKLAPLRRFMTRQAAARSPGPDEERRQSGQSQLWGEVRSADGRSLSARMTTPNGYQLTVLAGLGIVERVLADGPAEGGYYTPSLLMGSCYAESLPGVSLEFQD